MTQTIKSEEGRRRRTRAARMRTGGMMLALRLAAAMPPSAGGAETALQEHGAQHQEFVHGSPQVPSLEWTIAAGGRIYDTWWKGLDRPEPEGTNPVWPVSVNPEQSGPGTWRCKECQAGIARA
ncbi:MAG: hypothetical protein ACK4L4_10685 [Gemmobacter sp.]